MRRAAERGRVESLGRIVRALTEETGASTSSSSSSQSSGRTRSRLAQRVLTEDDTERDSQASISKQHKSSAVRTQSNKPQQRVEELPNTHSQDEPDAAIETPQKKRRRSSMAQNKSTGRSRRPKMEDTSPQEYQRIRAHQPAYSREKPQAAHERHTQPFQPMMRMRKDDLQQLSPLDRALLDEHAHTPSMCALLIQPFQSPEERSDLPSAAERLDQRKKTIMMEFNLQTEDEWQQVRTAVLERYEQKRSRVERNAREKGRSGLFSARDEDHAIDDMVDQARGQLSDTRLAFAQKAALALKHNPRIPFTYKQQMMRYATRQ